MILVCVCVCATRGGRGRERRGRETYRLHRRYVGWRAFFRLFLAYLLDMYSWKNKGIQRFCQTWNVPSNTRRLLSGDTTILVRACATYSCTTALYCWCSPYNPTSNLFRQQLHEGNQYLSVSVSLSSSLHTSHANTR